MLRTRTDHIHYAASDANRFHPRGFWPGAGEALCWIAGFTKGGLALAAWLA